MKMRHNDVPGWKYWTGIIILRVMACHIIELFQMKTMFVETNTSDKPTLHYRHKWLNFRKLFFLEPTCWAVEQSYKKNSAMSTSKSVYLSHRWAIVYEIRSLTIWIKIFFKFFHHVIYIPPDAFFIVICYIRLFRWYLPLHQYHRK